MHQLRLQRATKASRRPITSTRTRTRTRTRPSRYTTTAAAVDAVAVGVTGRSPSLGLP